MEFKQLEYFVRVAEAGSFTKASAILHVAQPALSRQIRQLEESLDTRLFTRNGRGAVVTEAGQRLLVQSRGILRQVARAREEIEGIRGTTVGRTAIGMPWTIASYFTLPLVKRFREQLPNVELTIVQGRSAALQDWLSSGRIDLAVLYDAPFSPQTEKVHLATEKLVLVEPADSACSSPISLDEIRSIPLIMPSQPNTVRMLVEMELGRLGHKPHIAMEIDNVANILELVSSGFGRAILSRRTVNNAARHDLHVRPIIEPELVVNLHLAIPIRPATPVQNAVLSVVKDVGRSIFN